MFEFKCFLAFVLYLTQGCVCNDETPVFSSQYSIEGMISLPYAEIEEPFVAYFDGNHTMSRIDFYGDLVQTIQRPDVDRDVGGVSYKLAYMVDPNGDAQRVCFRINATEEAPISAQSVLPDLTPFKLIQTEECPKHIEQTDSQCERWQYSVTNFNKTNNYVFWLIRDSHSNAIPFKYLMMGYDSLLGSHYDKYVVYYKSSTYSTDTLDPNVFDLASNYTCRSFPGPGIEHVGHHTPMQEFINGVDSHVDNEFDRFVDKHNKNYQNEKHERERKDIFRQNLRYIMSKNRQNIHYSLAVNHLADMTGPELKVLNGKLYSGAVGNGGLEFDKTKYSNDQLPEQWDWRLMGAVTPVKDQAVCGSCWSFGTTGTIEGVNFVKTGQLLKLSQQQLVDCSWNEGNNGCDGGEDFRAYQYIMKVDGLSTEEDYGHYLGADGKCHDKSVKKSIHLNGFYNVTPEDADALKTAIFNEGPVTVSLAVADKELIFYSSGVFYGKECKNKPEDLNHLVLAVGFGTLQGQAYWLIKNSWSTYWGNDGYFLISQKDNNCGILTEPTFPIIA